MLTMIGKFRRVASATLMLRLNVSDRAKRATVAETLL